MGFGFSSRSDMLNLAEGFNPRKAWINLLVALRQLNQCGRRKAELKMNYNQCYSKTRPFADDRVKLQVKQSVTCRH
jgi:hypothetical protein